MSELKRLNCFGNYDQFGGYYDADEADKVIAEKDKYITILQQSLQSAESVSSYRKRTIKEYEGKVDRMRTDISEKNTYISNLKNDITEKDAEIAELKKARNDNLDWCLHTLKENRHNKYKRCLAMARWCASRSASWCLDPADEQLHKSDFYDKWKFRWLELAKKFKPNKSTAQCGAVILRMMQFVQDEMEAAKLRSTNSRDALVTEEQNIEARR